MKRGISRIVEQHGNLHDVIPKVVNRVGQIKGAEILGVSPFTLNRWLKNNGYELKRMYVRKEEKAS